ncbi:MAG TPA: BrnT family toxin, partial [Candidatus Dormibacteraeota bacterium]|nr:BrnT family toxin [Candidatus Dormibacteraeota bacterium]
EEVFFNKPRIIFDDTVHSSSREKRYRVLGISTKGRALAVAFTVRNNKIRVIMARDQSRKERVFFEAKQSKEKPS